MHDHPDPGGPVTAEHREFIGVGMDFSPEPFAVPGHDQVPVFRGDQVGDGPVLQFRSGPAGHGGKRRVGKDEPAVLRNEDRIRALLNHRAVLDLALAQGILHLFPGGDIGEHPERSRKCPVRREEGGCCGQAPDDRPVLPDPFPLVPPGYSPRPPGEFLFHGSGIFRRHEVPDRASPHLLRQVPEDLLHFPVGEQGAEFPVNDPESPPRRSRQPCGTSPRSRGPAAPRRQAPHTVPGVPRRMP